jgi:hypothetical protein
MSDLEELETRMESYLDNIRQEWASVHAHNIQTHVSVMHDKHTEALQDALAEQAEHLSDYYAGMST